VHVYVCVCVYVCERVCAHMRACTALPLTPLHNLQFLSFLMGNDIFTLCWDF